MSRYIDKDELINRLTRMSKQFADKYIRWSLGSAVEDIIGIVDMQKEEDVAPIVHAHWTKYNGKPVESDSNGFPKDSCWCSRCHEWLVASDEYLVFGKYCPNCGAKMDEVVEDA